MPGRTTDCQFRIFRIGRKDHRRRRRRRRRPPAVRP